jgi:hypothetical protein
MMKRTIAIGVVLLTTLVWALSMRAETDPSIAYPVGYRQWVHVRSALVGPHSPIYERYGGLHHIYANDKAMAGYRSGRFPDGSILVFDVLETRESAGTMTEGPRRFVDVMVKDAQRFAETGGWGFEEYKGDSRTERPLTPQTRAACYHCHATQKARDSVFSTFRE